jgi:hypothetical protein
MRLRTNFKLERVWPLIGVGALCLLGTFTVRGSQTIPTETSYPAQQLVVETRKT